MLGIDYRGIFNRTLNAMIDEVFHAHGIYYLYEDELRSIVRECTRKVYWQSITELRKLTGRESIVRQYTKPKNAR